MLRPALLAPVLLLSLVACRAAVGSPTELLRDAEVVDATVSDASASEADASEADASDVDASEGDAGVQRPDSCGVPATIARGEWVERSIVVRGQSRVYFVRLPERYDPSFRYPVVYLFHGCQGLPNRETTSVRLEQASGDDAILVRTRSAEFCWDGEGELPYFDAIVDEVDGGHCTDPGRRFAVGYSGGAYFTHRLGCERGDRLLGIASIAGGLPGADCVGRVAVLQIHDVLDPIVSFTRSGIGTRDFWLERNHCGSTTTPTGTEPCVAYQGCDPGGQVVWCPTVGNGHSRTDEFSVPVIWTFLSSL